MALALNRAQAERLAPPRALYVEFPLGRPLGRPRDPGFQRRVLDAAFALLDAAGGSVLEDFGEVIHDEVDNGLACPLPPRDDAGVPRAVSEARGLRPAWERAREANGGSQVGRVVSADEVPDALEPFIVVAEGSPWDEVTFPGEPTTVLMDIRAYYEEAAMGLAGHVPAARAAETWYYQSTEAGRVVREFFAAVRDADPPFPKAAGILPVSQRR